MFGVVGRLFGTDRSLEKVVDSASSALDKLVYTDEERAEAAAEDRKEARAMVIKWMESTQGQNIARRLLAVLVTIQWLFLYNAGLLLGVVSIWTVDKERSAKIEETAEVVFTAAYQMNGAVMLILGFYFAAPHLGDIVKSAMGRFSRATTG